MDHQLASVAMVFVVLLELVCHCRWLFKPTEKAELVAMSISERNYFIWLFSFSSESVHEKRNGKRKGKHPEAVTVVSMISPTECSFSSFFALSVLFLIRHVKLKSVILVVLVLLLLILSLLVSFF